jgi:sulfur carrier protein
VSLTTLIVNGKPREVPFGSTATALLTLLGVHRNGVALAVNEVIVPRSQWSTVIFESGDRVEIVTAAAGG